MSTKTIRGYSVQHKPISLSNSKRTAVQLRNKIIANLKKIGIEADEDDVPEERLPIRKGSAYISWYGMGYYCFVAYNGNSRYIDNLAVISKLIEYEIGLVQEQEQSLQDFLEKYQENEDIIKRREEAYGLMELDDDFCYEDLNSRYRKLSKTMHPDASGGDEEKFKKLNEAHKIIIKELR